MAVSRKPQSGVKGGAPSNAVASMNPDNMLAGGLKDDFDGAVIKARVVPWDYDGNLDHHVLAVALTIQPDDDDSPFVQHYSAGDLEQFVPSMDGENPVDLERGEGEALEGVYALRVGKKEQLNSNTNWAQFLGALRDAGFDTAQMTPGVDFLEGVYGHWNRIPQKKRSGIVVQQRDDGKRRSQDILVITEIKQKSAAAAKPTPAARPTIVKGAKPATTTASGDLDSRLAQMVAEAVAASEEGIGKKSLGPMALKGFDGTEKAKALKRVMDAEFLMGHEDLWVYDEETATLFPAG